MKLTIEQALQQGVTAQKEGKLQEAERLYRSIIQSQPLHPDANHNLGILLVSLNKADAALPLLKTALEAKESKINAKLKQIDLMVKKARLDGNSSDSASGSGGKSLDRNELLRIINNKGE